jgi:hypothetical protein
VKEGGRRLRLGFAAAARKRLIFMSNAISVEQIEQAKPQRLRVAPARTRSHYDRILGLLRERGPAGVLASELYDAPHLYGRSPRNRISEIRADLKKDGDFWEITGEARGASDWHYVLRSKKSSSDWYEREIGQPRASGQTPRSSHDDLPLFSGALRS